MVNFIYKENWLVFAKVIHDFFVEKRWTQITCPENSVQPIKK